MIDKKKPSIVEWLEQVVAEEAFAGALQPLEIEKWILVELEKPTSTAGLVAIGHDFHDRQRKGAVACIVPEEKLSELQARIESYLACLQEDAEKSQKQ